MRTAASITFNVIDTSDVVSSPIEFRISLDSLVSEYNTQAATLTVEIYDDNYETATWHLNPTAEAINSGVLELTEGGDAVTLALTISNAPDDTFMLSKTGGTGAHTGVVTVGSNGDGIGVDHTGGLVESMSVDSTNWDDDRELVITPTDDPDSDDEVYVITVGYAASVPESWVTLRQLLGEPAIVEEVAITIRVTDDDPGFGFTAPSTTTDEGSWAALAISLIGPGRTDAATIQVSSGTPGFETNRNSDTVEIGSDDFSVHVISIRLADNDRYEGEVDIPVTITDPGASLTERSFTFTVGDDDSDRFGLVVDDVGTARLGSGRDIAVRLGSEPLSGNVVLTVGYDDGFVDATTSAMVSVTVMPSTLTFTTANWDENQRFTLSASTDTTLMLTASYAVTVGVDFDSSSADRYGVEATGPAPVTLDIELRSGGVFAEQDVASTETALAVVDLGAAQFALDAIGGNFIGGGNTQLAPSLNLGGTSGVTTDATDPWAQDGSWRGDFVSLLDGGSFRLPLAAGVGLGRLDIWGEGRLLDVSGDGSLDDGGTYTYDGGATGFVLGFGLRDNSGRMGYGIAVARTSSHVDLQGESLSVERVDNDLVTLLPYVGLSFGSSSRAWLVGGVGEGEAEVLMSGDVEKTDSTVRSVGVGVEHTANMGDYDVSSRLLASGSRSTLDGTERVPDLANVRGSAHRVRAEAEIERDLDMGRCDPARGGMCDGTVYGVAALRHDGGDAGGSFGLELGVGVRARLHDAFSVELEGRHQINPSSNEESSVRLRLGYDTDNDGRGLGAGLEESGAASVGYGWGRTVLGRHGVLSLGVGREGHGEAATTKLGFVSPGLRMSVAGDADELRADFDLIVLGR